MDIIIRNGEERIEVTSLKWEDAKGKYVPIGNPHTVSIYEEVLMIFNQVWTDWMGNIRVSTEASSTEVYRTMMDNALYAIDQFYRAGRYSSPLTMTYVANAVSGYIWDYFQMDDRYDEADDYHNKVIS